ncbi:MAG TPA: magnesium transporter [Verrucomicrobiae bacterium]|nr:magnesium transporter [Verrucomicrobiae bacterium]
MNDLPTAQVRAELQELIRAARTRVPVDAATLLAQEPPATIEAVLRALPHDLALRIALELPKNLRPQGDEGDTQLPVPGQVSELADAARGVLPSGTTVQQAIEMLRKEEAVADITYLFVVDGQQKLIGLVVMRDLLLAQPSQAIDDIMIRKPFTLSPGMDIGDAIKAAVRRHYPVYPVVDTDGRLLGQVRGWRLAERQAIEISAQAGRMVGVTGEQVDTPIWEAFKKRHVWLQVNLLTAFLAGWVVSMFEGTITQIVVLAAFLPVLAGQSGNTGCQALAISLRGLTLGNFDQIPRARLLLKEGMLGALNGLGTGLVAATAMWLYAGSSEGSTGNPLTLGLVILLAMTGACVSSGLSGVLIPVTLRKFGFDPATASSIFLTTVTDIVGMGLMLLLATTLVL